MDSTTPLKVDRTIKLAQLVGAVEDARDAKKSALFIDETGQVQVFFCYKACLFELSRLRLAKTIGKKSAEEVNEEFRKIIINTMRSGAHLAISVEKDIPDFKTEFADKTCVPPQLFDQKGIDNKEVFEPLLRDGDDHDRLGNKNCFHIQEGWMVSVVTIAPFETAAAAA